MCSIINFCIDNEGMELAHTELGIICYYVKWFAGKMLFLSKTEAMSSTLNKWCESVSAMWDRLFNPGVENSSFKWSFQPILICLRLYGISLRWNEKPGTLCRFFELLSCLFWLVVNIAIVILTPIQKTSHNVNNAKYYYYPIAFANNLVLGAGIYIAMIFAAWKHGRQLIDSFEQLETHFAFDQKTYGKIRIVSFIGVLLSITIVSDNSRYVKSIFK